MEGWRGLNGLLGKQGAVIPAGFSPSSVSVAQSRAPGVLQLQHTRKTWKVIRRATVAGCHALERRESRFSLSSSHHRRPRSLCRRSEKQQPTGRVVRPPPPPPPHPPPSANRRTGRSTHAEINLLLTHRHCCDKLPFPPPFTRKVTQNYEQETGGAEESAVMRQGPTPRTRLPAGTCR